MEFAVSSNALDASTPTHDLKFMMASNINVSNFISVKLSGCSNYKIWKAQMLCLIESQVLLHMVNAEHPFPIDKGVSMISQYDKLVKGWIFGSLNEKVLKDLVDSGTAQEVWMKLESLFNLPVSDTEGHSSHAHDVSALDVIAPVVSAMREDLKYIQALNVDISNFVSEKLVDNKNYYNWKIEMLYLIESHELLHIIHSEARFPWDKADPMTQKYDSLVRGWILSTMNDKQRHIYQMYRSVQLMWRNLESTFTYQPKTSNNNTGDTTDDSSNETEDLKYMQLKSNVNVSNFVSVKLSGRSNYSIWKDQMLCLLESHNLLHIIHAEGSPSDKDDPMTQKYANLVRGWILSTMNDEECHKYRIYRSVQLMWRNLESTFDETKDLKYMEASNVNVSNFVLVNLANHTNYSIWRAQVLYLLESHNLLHIINGGYCSEEDKYDELVKGWILCTVNDELLKDFPADNYVDYTAKYLWDKLASHFKYGYSRLEHVVSASTQDLKYTQALNVNVSNFVSVKLFGSSNYRIWKAQMLFLIKSQKLIHVIDNHAHSEVDKYDHLVQGWIFSTMSEQLLSKYDFTDDESAKDIWKLLKSTFDRQDPQGVTFGINFINGDTEFVNDLPELDNTDKKRWYKATAEGWWRKAKSILKINKNADTEATTANDNTLLHVAVETESSRTEFVRDTTDIETKNSRLESVRKLYEATAEGRWRKAKSILENSKIEATEAITANGNTILHVAVEMGHNYFVEELLEFLKNGEDVEKKNEKGRTALHIAAMVGNTHAAQLLVQKREELLVIKDNDEYSPLHLASENMNLNIYACLFKSLAPSDSSFRSTRSLKSTILAAIFSKQYGIFRNNSLFLAQQSSSEESQSSISCSMTDVQGSGEESKSSAGEQHFEQISKDTSSTHAECSTSININSEEERKGVKDTDITK